MESTFTQGAADKAADPGRLVQQQIADTISTMMKLGQCGAQLAVAQAHATQTLWVGLIGEWMPHQNGEMGEPSALRDLRTRVDHEMQRVRHANDDLIAAMFDLAERAGRMPEQLASATSAFPYFHAPNAMMQPGGAPR